MLEVRPRIPFAALFAELQRAHLLLAVVGDHMLYSTPYKVYDYMAAGRPILGIAPRGAALFELLADSGAGDCIERDDAAGIERRARAVHAWRGRAGARTGRPVSLVESRAAVPRGHRRRWRAGRPTTGVADTVRRALSISRSRTEAAVRGASPCCHAQRWPRRDLRMCATSRVRAASGANLPRMATEPLPGEQPGQLEALLDRWQTSLDLHARYAALDDARYWHVQPGRNTSARSAGSSSSRASASSRSSASSTQRQAEGDRAFVEGIETMGFLATLVGLTSVERFIPLATHETERREVLSAQTGAARRADRRRHRARHAAPKIARAAEARARAGEQRRTAPRPRARCRCCPTRRPSSCSPRSVPARRPGQPRRAATRRDTAP